MREPRDYNEYGPETCLEDEVFNLIWLFYMTHKVPKTSTGDMLLNVLSISRKHGLLYPYKIFDPCNISDKEIADFARRYFWNARIEIMVNEFVFWMFYKDGETWRARRFATQDDSSGLFNLENVKRLLKLIAIEEGILSEEV